MFYICIKRLKNLGFISMVGKIWCVGVGSLSVMGMGNEIFLVGYIIYLH